MNSRLISIIFDMIFVLSTILTTGCEPRAPFQIQNNTNQTLKIFIAVSSSEHIDEKDVRILVGSVEPSQILKPEGESGSFRTYLVEARDSGGNVVYSKEFTAEQLMKAKWRVVISTSQ